MSTLSRVRESFRDWLDDTALRAPARIALSVFASVILIVTVLLQLPQATSSGERASFVDALFTSTSAVCVTGLTVQNTGDYWSTFGQTVILIAIKVGGLGIMTLASLLGLAVSRRLGLTQRMLAAEESRASGLGDVRSMLRIIVVISGLVELAIAAVLFPRLLQAGQGMGEAAFHAIFYGVSAFNNAGFVPESSLTPYVSDYWVLAPIAIGVLIGSLGFPVYLALLRGWSRPRTWPLHTKLTLVATAILTVGSAVFLALFEWTNPETIGNESVHDKGLNLFFMSINQRSGGFSTFDVGSTHEHTWLLEDVLMFIGGGSGGTAGGIRVTTVAVIVLAIVAEMRGRRDVEAYGKRIGTESVRVAITVMVFGLVAVIVGTGAILIQTADLPGYTLDRVMYDTISAYATCGLSTGVAGPDAPDGVKITLTILMFIGRLGGMTVAAALALNKQRRVIRYPKEAPIIG